MSSSEFRQILLQPDTARGDRLLRAAISAFCALGRPSRREIAQIEDLAAPLLPSASRETLRYVAAALCECEAAPVGLVRRLCEEPPEICAPLLLRSKALADIDLIALIGRHGAAHARVIARRTGLTPAIADLTRLVLRARPVEKQPPAPARLSSASQARERLRAMMRPAGSPASPAEAHASLREAALTGQPGVFATRLSELMDVEAGIPESLLKSDSYEGLLAAFRHLDLSEAQAFLIVAALYPRLFPHPHAIRLFLERYAAVDREKAGAELRGWKADSLAARIGTSPFGKRQAG